MTAKDEPKREFARGVTRYETLAKETSDRELGAFYMGMANELKGEIDG